MKIIVDAVKAYYATKVGVDITSANVMQKLRQGILSLASLHNSDDPLLFHNIENLVQTENSFENGACDSMVQLFIFVFAMFLHDDELKERFIEPIMDLEEDCQMCLQGIIEESSELIDQLQGEDVV